MPWIENCMITWENCIAKNFSGERWWKDAINRKQEII